MLQVVHYPSSHNLGREGVKDGSEGGRGEGERCMWSEGGTVSGTVSRSLIEAK